MSGVWGWFGGGSSQNKKDTPKNAILGLRSQLEMLQKRERHLQSQMDEQDAIARKNISTNKNGMSHHNLPLCFDQESEDDGVEELTIDHSRKSRTQAQEAARAYPRPDTGTNLNFGAADLQYRSREYQPRDASCNGEGWPGYEADSWQAQY